MKCTVKPTSLGRRTAGRETSDPNTSMNPKLKTFLKDAVGLPLVGVVIFLMFWTILSYIAVNPRTGKGEFPTPFEAWNKSRQYFVAPFTNNEAEGYRGIGLEAWDSLKLVAQGYIAALIVAVPIGFMLGSSKTFTKIFDPIFQILRPVSPLAWFPLAGVIVLAMKQQIEYRFPGSKVEALEWQCVFTIGICAIWPTILNTAVGVRAIPNDYLNVARVLKLSTWKRFTRILLPATLPYMFTGFRLSLGIAWLVIVAAEMLAGKPGIGNFLWNSYNGGNYGAMIASILVIGSIGFFLDRLMNLAEKNVNLILSLPSLVGRLLKSKKTQPVAAASFNPVPAKE
jgi:nitrate/nitrite transport system permease protein